MNKTTNRTIKDDLIFAIVTVSINSILHSIAQTGFSNPIRLNTRLNTYPTKYTKNTLPQIINNNKKHYDIQA